MDRYDQDILDIKSAIVEQLWNHPNSEIESVVSEVIQNRWEDASPLFYFAGKMFDLEDGWDSMGCGCLTQIRGDEEIVAATPELTLEIRQDERIPKNEKDITLEMLPVFAERQRWLDVELDRKWED